jgi:hypothetical protein
MIHNCYLRSVYLTTLSISQFIYIASVRLSVMSWKEVAVA